MYSLSLACSILDSAFHCQIGSGFPFNPTKGWPDYWVQGQLGRPSLTTCCCESLLVSSFEAPVPDTKWLQSLMQELSCIISWCYHNNDDVIGITICHTSRKYDKATSNNSRDAISMFINLHMLFVALFLVVRFPMRKHPQSFRCFVAVCEDPALDELVLKYRDYALNRWGSQDSEGFRCPVLHTWHNMKTHPI